MNSNFTAGFSDELIKEAKYPISRLLTSRAVSGAGGLAEGAMAGMGVFSPAMGGARMLHQHLIRSVGGRALHGRLVRGGKGLMGHEKKKLSEALGVSGPKLDKMIASYAKANKGGKTHPISRAVSTPYTGIGAIRRLADTRAMAGRAGKGGKGMTKREKSILAELGAHGKAVLNYVSVFCPHCIAPESGITSWQHVVLRSDLAAHLL